MEYAKPEIIFYVRSDRIIYSASYVIVVEKFHTVFQSDFHYLPYVILIFYQIHDTLSYIFGSTTKK